MSMPSWSPRAFEMRVKMAMKPTIFLVFEGKETDPWFYEQLVAKSKLRGEYEYELQPVELVDVENGDRSGGKARVLNLYKRMKSSGSLDVKTSGGRKVVMFCVDADHDRLTGRYIRSKYVTYTRHADAEAELLNSCDIVKLIQVLTSSGKAEAEKFAASIEGWQEELAKNWREWFFVCLIALFSGVGGPRVGAPPVGAKRVAGDCDADHVKATLVKMRQRSTSSASWQNANRLAKLKLDRYYDSGRERELLKGKWLAAVLKGLIDGYSRKNGGGRVRSDESIYVAIRSVADFSGRWTSYYTARFDALAGIGEAS
ncbi:DUF4435 domain-containing protein [Amycolatopsis sp. 195334CR]|uniref:DUF4435 domain-containing protein n=1 Tax=Amycolatopsis sp. 195334CR TaxID=2814588 RepID=UPI001A8E28E0|nr:DUF4435 domain-containing protein [Amycolatopsis sp. 195334CR]MBN6036242.1 hypothetical protein [Amycolatopsis sp. 195334CR]